MKPTRLLFALLSLLALAWPASAKPLQVYILAGQSNMQGHAKVSTFEHIGMDPATKPMLAEMTGPDGKPKVCDRVWISSIGCAEGDAEQTGKLTAGFGAGQGGPKIGPEFTFGLYMQKFTDAPILLIKTSWGGKSLNTDFRPPSAGPYVFNETQLADLQKKGKDLAALKAEKEKATGVNYRLMIEHVKKVLVNLKRVVPEYDAKQGYELAGFAWLQGWNDMVDSGTYPNRDKAGGYDAYSTVLADFIRDVRKDLNAPKLPFVIGVIGVGGPTAEYGPDQQRYKATHDNFRAAMAAPAQLPEFKGNVAALLTERYWDQELTVAKAKDTAIQQQAKKLAADGKLPPAEQKAALEKLRTEGLTERERLILEKGISNLEFHYLGSAKILGGIGKGFAETMAELKQLKPSK
ncbi:MAG TPA: sialate O-acetylesterase [Chthoniobacteraceae bacterium]|jgi:alpha-galactosidase|nr:sialate O-acetylesterase [Chthoniobacteraceae bacterium]